MDKALFYHRQCGPTFDPDIWLSVKDDDLKEYNYNRCRQCSYEKAISETKNEFLIEDYEVFQIVKKEV